MIVKLIKKKSPTVLIAVLFIAILLWGNSLHIYKNTISHSNNGNTLLFSIINGYFTKLNQTWLIYFISLVLISFQTFYITRINLKYSIVSTSSFIVAFIFILLNGALVSYNYIHPLLIANIFLIGSIEELFKSVSKDKATNNVFNASLLIAFSSLFFFNYIYLLLFVIISVFITGENIFKEILASILGFITIYLLLIFIYFLFTGNFSELWETIKNEFVAKYIFEKQTVNKIIFWSIMSLIIIISVTFSMQTIMQKKTEVRLYYQIFIVLFVNLLILFIFTRINIHMFYFALSIPATFTLSNYLHNEKKNLRANLIFLVFILMIAYNHFIFRLF